MIQRIQSIYLLIVVFLSGLLLHFNLLCFIDGQTIYDFTIFGLTCETPSTETSLDYSAWPLAAVNLIILGVALYSIFMYKKRMLQIRLNNFNLFLQIGFYILIAVYVLYIKYSTDAELVIAPQFALIIPFINIVFTFLAIRAIGADEALVRSVDHLR